MAITAATKNTDFSGFLTREQAQPIFDEARRSSVVQQLAREVQLGINGESIPVVTTKPVAGWVAEGAQKPATQGGMNLINMDPKKLAAIIVVSSEVVRANPGNYMNNVRAELAEAFAIAFDAAALHGTNTPFAAYLSQTTKSVEIGTATQAAGGVYRDVVSGLSLLVSDGRKFTGSAWGLTAEPLFLGATDTTGRPLFVEAPLTDAAPSLQQGRMIGRSAFIGEGVNSGTLQGFAGDWSKIVWGAVGGIQYDVSTEATVTINGALVSLWENNLVAIRAEAEYGLAIQSVAEFVKFVDAV